MLLCRLVLLLHQNSQPTLCLAFFASASPLCAYTCIYMEIYMYRHSNVYLYLYIHSYSYSYFETSINAHIYRGYIYLGINM